MVRIESSQVVASRDPTIDPSELRRRRIYLFRDTSIVGFLLLLSLPFASRSRAALAKYSRVRRMEGAGRFAPVFSLSLFFYHSGRIHKTFSVHISSQILGGGGLAPSRFGAAVRGPPARSTPYTGVEFTVERVETVKRG